MQLFVRALDQLEPTVLVGGQPPRPVPLAQWPLGGLLRVGYGAARAQEGRHHGRAIHNALSLDSPSSGATWGDDDSVIFATTQSIDGPPACPVHRRRAGGPDDTRPRAWRRRSPLAAISARQPGGPFHDHIDNGWHGRVAGRGSRLANGYKEGSGAGGSQAQYTPSGHLVYAAAGTLLAVAFDAGRLEVVGTSTPVLSQVATLPDWHSRVRHRPGWNAGVRACCGERESLLGGSCGWTVRDVKSR